MRVRGQLLSLAMVWSVPLGIAAVFPYEAIVFRARGDGEGHVRGRASLVSLSAAQEQSFEQVARTTWRKEGGANAWRPDLLVDNLPETPCPPVLPIAVRSRPPEPPIAECGVSAFLPSRQAPPPLKIAPDKVEDAQAFPRTELLKLN